MVRALLLPALALAVLLTVLPAAARASDDPRPVPRAAYSRTAWALPEMEPFRPGESPFDQFRNGRTDFGGQNDHYRCWIDAAPIQSKFTGYYDPGDGADNLTRIDFSKLQLKPESGIEAALHIVWFPLDRGAVAAGMPLSEFRTSWVFRYGTEFQRGVLQTPFAIQLDDRLFVGPQDFRTSLDWNHWEMGKHEVDPDLYEWEWVIRHVRGRLHLAPTDGSPAGSVYFDGGHDRFVYDRFVVNTGFFRLRLGFALNPAVAVFRLFFARTRDTVGVYAEGRIGMDFVASPEWRVSIGAAVQTPTIIEARQTPNVVAYGRQTGYILVRFGF